MGFNGLKMLIFSSAAFLIVSFVPIISAAETVKLGVARELLSSLAFIAEERGFFSMNDLDVKVSEYESGKLALDAMFSGEVDLATVAETPVVFSSLKRRDFGIIATIGSSDNEPAIVARKDRGVLKGSDLKGKRIATQQGSAVHFFLHLFLLKNGLTEKDVRILFKKPDELAGALVSGEIDAISIREPIISRAANQLGGNAVVLTAAGLYNKSFHVVATSGFIKGRQDAARRVLRGLLQAEEFAKKDRKAAIRIVAKRLGIDGPGVASLFADAQLRVGLDQCLLLCLEEEARWATETGLAKGPAGLNYLDFISTEALMAVKPNAVTLVGADHSHMRR